VSLVSKGVVTDYALYILVSLCIILSLFSFVSLSFDSLNLCFLSFILILISISNTTELKN
jgi:hypothetical protein